MKYVYAALLTQSEDGGYIAEFPDLPGCYTQGDDLHEVIYMAETALTEWLEYLSDKNIAIPQPSTPNTIKPNEEQFVSYIRAGIRDEIYTDIGTTVHA